MLLVTFDEEMDPATLSAASVQVKNLGDQSLVPGRVDASGKSAAFVPAAPLDFSTEYEVTLTTDVADLAGNSLAEAHVWTFTTGDVSQLDLSAPYIVSRTPSGPTARLDETQAITVRFNEPVNLISVNELTFRVRDASTGMDVYGSVSSSADTAVFTPEEELREGGFYTVTVSSEVSDTAGNTLEADEIWSFSVHARVWGTPYNIEDLPQGTVALHATTNARGDVLFTWLQRTDESQYLYDVWARVYRHGRGWEPAVMIRENPVTPGMAFHARGLLQDDGSATVLVVERRISSPGGIQVYTRTFDPESGWSAFVPLVAKPDTSAYGAELESDGNGVIHAVWREATFGDLNNSTIWTARFIPGSGWTAPQSVRPGAYFGYVALSVAEDGTAFISFVENGSVRMARAIHYTPAGGWGAAVDLSSQGGNNVSTPSIATWSDGSAIAFWSTMVSTGASTYSHHVYFSRFAPSTGAWSTPVDQNSAGAAGLSSVQVVTSADGSAMAVWHGYVSSSTSVFAKRFPPGSATGDAVRVLDRAGDSREDSPSLAMDARGRAWIAWSGVDASPNLRLSRFVPGEGWSESRAHPTISDASIKFTRVISNASGDATVHWYNSQPSGDYDLWTMMYR